MTIREYAKKHGISYEAVRKQISNYRTDLDGHITTDGKTKYLDDFAVEFLDKRRRSNPVVVLRQSEREETELLRDQVEALKNELLTTQKRVIELQSENQLMIEAKVKYDLLLESNTEKQKQIEDLKTEIRDVRDAEKSARAAGEEAKRETDQLRKETEEAKKSAEKLKKERDAAAKEAKSYRKSIFGLYKRVKN